MIFRLLFQNGLKKFIPQATRISVRHMFIERHPARVVVLLVMIFVDGYRLPVELTNPLLRE